MSSFVDGVGIASGAVALGLGVGTIWSGSRLYWRRTFGSRRSLTYALNQLAVGTPAENLPNLLGACTLRRDADASVGQPVSEDDRGMEDLRQEVYLTKHACIDAFIEPHRDTVIAFSVTVTDPRFTFDLDRLSFGFLRGVRLGRTTFGSPRVPREPGEVKWWDGARYTGYAEAHYGANPAGYQSYVLAYLQNGSGHLSYEDVPGARQGGLSTGRYVEAMEISPGMPIDSDEYVVDEWAWFRAKTTINTLQVIGPTWSGSLSYPGVHSDLTRLVRQPPRTVRQRTRDRIADVRGS